MSTKTSKNQRPASRGDAGLTWWQARGLTRHLVLRGGRRRVFVWVDGSGREVAP